jgi:hypothetical protein
MAPGDGWVPGPACDEFYPGSRLCFDSSTVVHDLAARDNKVYRVQLTVPPKP